MALKIKIKSDKSGGTEEVEGSDRRLNTSSRSDSRAYYNSRDESQTYSLVWNDASTATGDVIASWQNNDTSGKVLVINLAKFSSEFRADFQLIAATGTATGGTTTLVSCLNRSKLQVAAAAAMTAVTTPITGLTTEVIAYQESAEAGAKGNFDVADTFRVPQGQSVAVLCLLTDTSPGKTSGMIEAYYE